jgi:hypothetical protein
MWVGIECLDAGYMSAIARSVREVAALRARVPFTLDVLDWLTVEPVAERSRTVEVDGRQIILISPNPSPYVRTHVWGTDARAMVALLNYSETDTFRMAVKATRPDAVGYKLVDPLTGRQLMGDDGEVWSLAALERGATIEVPPQGLATVVVSVAK